MRKNKGICRTVKILFLCVKRGTKQYHNISIYYQLAQTESITARCQITSTTLWNRHTTTHTNGLLNAKSIFRVILNREKLRNSWRKNALKTLTLSKNYYFGKIKIMLWSPWFQLGFKRWWRVWQQLIVVGKKKKRLTPNNTSNFRKLRTR